MAGVLDSVNQRTQLVGKNRLELLLFRLSGDQLYGINVFKVKEVLQCPPLTQMPQSKSVVKGVAHVRGGTIPILDLSLAIGQAPLTDIENKLTIITEYNMRNQGFMVRGVERIININWEEVQPPPKGSGHEHFLTAVTRHEDNLVEIIDVERILADVAPMKEDVSDGIITEEATSAAVSKQVLIVDDSKIARKQMTKTLEQVGLTVVALNDGREALDHLLGLVDDGVDPVERYPIVISDIEMPEMDGYTLTTHIRAHDKLKGLYILLHTSLSGVFNKNMVQKVGANEFLAKFQPDMLAQLVIERVTNLGGELPAVEGDL
ncbi:chemotaxis protein CheW [Saccharospirillum sp. MSK14-1]|uniref:chemotaxis protein CheV n=1 Tax=Saccharospirillum sp. MSK14-1 TaxID=1897632 RepID=UPI000D33A7F4|nr:chemotaxis protein CheV [Saccharospirillum sp. MSK14-1]PTY36793.1 chemotaxis protein CheW [Saccharospirillum sp. MSK14-1]